jgi:hypothetical protein
MNKSVVVCVLAFFSLVSGGFAETFVIVDIQDANNWGDYFLPAGMEPRSGSAPKYLPYYRWDDNDWGWTHTLSFELPPAEIISATLEVEAWDVRLSEYEIHKLYGDDIYLGPLTPPPGIEGVSPNTFNDLGWSTTKIVLESEAIEALKDGTMDIWLDIDANTDMPPGEGCRAVTLKSSKLIVLYSTDSSDEPDVPPTGQKLPPDKPDVPSDGNSLQLRTYSLNPVDISLPTINEPGDGISQIGVEQAWFAFDLSDIPDGDQIVSASFSANMRNYLGIPTQRTLWYHADDSWIVTTIPNVSDPGNMPADGPVIGTIIHEDSYWSFVTIDIDVSASDWSKDLIDNYVTFMLTGPIDGHYVSGAVDLTTAELEISTLSASGPINDDNEDVLITLGPEELVQADNFDIVVAGYSVPSCFDWNNDDLQDLVIGQGGGSGDAKVRVYLNLGTESSPRFSDSFCFYVQSYTSALTCPAKDCLGCFPRVLYWDFDACKDLLVGQADGTVKIFRNLWTDIMPIFDYGTFLTVGKAGMKENINVGGRATPAVVDWNNDGRKDLVIGALDGKIRIFINEGTDTEPDFILESFAQENGANLIVPGGRSSPDVLDMDYDGRKDILTGNTDGQLLFYRNVGTDDAPEFSGYTLVESAGVAIDLPGSPRSRPFLCYWNIDDYPDVLVGAGDGKVHLYLGLPIAALY